MKHYKLEDLKKHIHIGGYDEYKIVSELGWKGKTLQEILEMRTLSHTEKTYIICCELGKSIEFVVNVLSRVATWETGKYTSGKKLALAAIEKMIGNDVPNWDNLRSDAYNEGDLRTDCARIYNRVTRIVDGSNPVGVAAECGYDEAERTAQIDWLKGVLS